jgi:hypothetical protein
MMDPAATEARRLLRKQYRQNEKVRYGSYRTNHRAAGGPRVTEEELSERKAEIPSDTRTVTAQFCGDPLPGRSALDRRNL